MKRILLHVSLMLVMFVVGLAADWLIGRTNVEQIPELPKTVAAPLTTNLPLLPTGPVTIPARHLIFDYNPERNYLDGDFLLLGQPPKELAEVKSFAMWAAGDGGHSPGGLNLLLQSSNPSEQAYDTERAVFALVTKRRIFFATAEGKNGYAYRFDGEFLRNDMTAVDHENTPVLRGTLTKMKNGRRVAERSVRFGVIVHGC